jgi:amidohydrolase
METWSAESDRCVDEHFGQLIELRRHLHAHPELSGAEHETSLHLYQLLGDAGFAVRLGPEGRGVVADIEGGTDLGVPSLALRADMDALRIHDEKDVPYRSQRVDVMHACGHDAHTAIAVGALLAVKRLADRRQLPWPVPLRGILQPAEETCQGALEMIGAGALEGVQVVLATHVDPSLQVGRIGIRNGLLTANCNEMLITIRGSGGHAARPHETDDPIAAAAQFINALYLHIPRHIDSQDAVVVTIGRVAGGDNANVIPERVELWGTFRTLSADVRERTSLEIQQIAAGMAQTTRTRIEVQFGIASPSINNDARVVEHLRRAAIQVVGVDAVQEIARPSMGSEDFAFYLQQVPGAMFRLGVTSPGAKVRGLHTPTFDIDEEAIRIGAKIMARAAVAWFDPQR